MDGAGYCTADSDPVPALSSLGCGQAVKKKSMGKKSGKAEAKQVFFTSVCFGVMPFSLLPSAPLLNGKRVILSNH
jgi:hypothetical protein